MLFSKSAITSPLLTDEEIKPLIYSTANNQQPQQKLIPEIGKIGNLLSSQKGFGSDFAEVRAYHNGDDLRHIDWRATARSKTPLVRTYYSELSSPLCIVIDKRKSMRFGTRCRLKVTQAVRLALFLASSEIRSGRELSIVILDIPNNHWLPPQRGMQALKMLIDYANSPCPPTHNHALVSDDYQQDNNNWGKILANLAQYCPNASELILISDFSGLFTNSNDSKDKINTRLLAKIGHHCSTKAIRIFDPIEVNLALSLPINLNWGSNKLDINPLNKHKNTSSKDQLSIALEKWQKLLSKNINRAGILYCELSVEQNNLSKVIYND